METLKKYYNKLIDFLTNIGIPKNCKSCKHQGTFGCRYDKGCTMYKVGYIYPHSPEQEQLYKDLDERDLFEYYLKQIIRLPL